MKKESNYMDADDVYAEIIRDLKAQNVELLEALNDLFGEQNDAPIERRRKEWELAMAKARAAIEKAEKK